MREGVVVHWDVGLNKKQLARFYFPKDAGDLRLMVGESPDESWEGPGRSSGHCRSRPFAGTPAGCATVGPASWKPPAASASAQRLLKAAASLPSGLALAGCRKTLAQAGRRGL